MFVEILLRYSNMLCHTELVGCNWVNNLGAMLFYFTKRYVHGNYKCSSKEICRTGTKIKS